jgi:hypothetical protein
LVLLSWRLTDSIYSEVRDSLLCDIYWTRYYSDPGVSRSEYGLGCGVIIQKQRTQVNELRRPIFSPGPDGLAPVGKNYGFIYEHRLGNGTRPSMGHTASPNVYLTGAGSIILAPGNPRSTLRCGLHFLFGFPLSSSGPPCWFSWRASPWYLTRMRRKSSRGARGSVRLSPKML